MHIKCEVNVACIFKWKQFWFFIGYSAHIDRLHFAHIYDIYMHKKNLGQDDFFSEINDHFLQTQKPITSLRELYLSELDMLQWRMQDFLLGGGANPTRGHQCLIRVLFGENVCENERIGSCWMGRPLDSPLTVL